MSGTSLDGLDIAYCEFYKNKKIAKANPSFSGWKCEIIYAETINYNKEWKEKLSSAFRILIAPIAIGETKKESRLLSGSKLDIEFGKFIGEKVNAFIKKNKIKPDFISSHGHTVFHQPEKKFTLQIGDGKTISRICKLPVVCDFRSDDVALGGQGAPLVPIADKFLFSDYDFCLNLGGIANISFDNKKNQRIAFDICPANIVLNDLAYKLGKEFDKNGESASKGKINNELLAQLNNLSFYKTNPPKSLGREWICNYFFSVFDSFSISIQDKLRTVVEHIAIQISLAVKSAIAIPIAIGTKSAILITGGGAYNSFLIKRISAHTKCKVILPQDKMIQFKEAMAFAFLGVLRMRNEINILKSVTGAKKDSSGGKIYRM